MNYQIVKLRPSKDHILTFNHPWIFSQAIQQPASSIKNGAFVDIYSSNGKFFLARGYYNNNSQILIRILTRDPKELINEAFFEKHFRELHAVRQRFINTTDTNAYRMVFGESDGIPGLIIDKYAGTYVIQIHTLGMEMLRDCVIAAMKKVFNPVTIFERSDVGVRRHEGLRDMPVRHVYGKEIKNDAPSGRNNGLASPRLGLEIEIREHGIKFLVNVKEGQKTGFFLDQRDNRKALQRYASGKQILNCFCYTAGFSVYAALAGARETVNVDVSGEALETAKRNFTLNKIPLKNHQFIDGDVFNILGDFTKKKQKFDIIILDPPAFVKNQKSLKNGLSGYLYINEQALGLLPHGGILATSSCSAHVTDEMFQKMLAQAASRAGCALKTLEIRHQPIDHPFNVHFPEGKYLKFYVMLKV